MGLLQFLRRLLFGSGNDPGATTVPVKAPANRKIGFRLRRELQPLRHQSTLVRTPPERELVKGKPPYRFAIRSVRTGRWLDLSTDSDPRWLEFYGLPALRTPEELAAWLQISPGRLAWLTHRFRQQFRPARMSESHYHSHWMDKRSGGKRLIEAPKPLLKQVQTKILREVLEKVPAHKNAHGFVIGRSIVTNAQPHVGQRILLKIDLENFYPSVRYSRVVAIYRSLGFSREVAIWLARLTTSAATDDVFQTLGGFAYPLYRGRHLPQGAPTSPALANLSAYSLDVRLTGLASRYGVTYTRYADDLTFSGSKRFGGALKEFSTLVTRIVQAERLQVNRRKRKIIRNNQRQTVTGVVVNSHCNIARSDFDWLKAILTNCVRQGPRSQNRESHPDFGAHLRGKVAHAMQISPRRGAKLLKLYQAIDWSK